MVKLSFAGFVLQPVRAIVEALQQPDMPRGVVVQDSEGGIPELEARSTEVNLG